MNKTLMKSWHFATMTATFTLLMLVGLFLAAPSWGAEKILNTTAESVTEAVDKNGNPYVRIIVREQRELAGNTYFVGLPAMCFGAELVTAAKGINPGDSFKAIVQGRTFQGRDSYTVISFLD